MSLNPRIWLRAAVVAAFFYFACPARATINYTVSLSHPERHIFGVTIRIPNVRDQVTLQMPAWNALYQIRDFSSHMMQVTAKDEEGRLLALRKLDKQTWSVSGTGVVNTRSWRAAEVPSTNGHGNARAVARLGLELQRKVQAEKLSGQVLKVRTGSLRSSINTKVTDTPSEISAMVARRLSRPCSRSARCVFKNS